MGFIHEGVAKATCVLTILIAISASCSLVLGFINLGTFHSTQVQSHVGIWVGLVVSHVCI